MGKSTFLLKGNKMQLKNIRYEFREAFTINSGKGECPNINIKDVPPTSVPHQIWQIAKDEQGRKVSTPVCSMNMNPNIDGDAIGRKICELLNKDKSGKSFITPE